MCVNYLYGNQLQAPWYQDNKARWVRSGITKSHNMPPKGNKQTQKVGANNPALASISQPTFQFIECLNMDGTVDDSSHTRFKTRKLRCENILEAEHASLPDKTNARFFSDG